MLVERAAQAIAYAGYNGLSLRQLATDAGTSTAAIYSLFGGKSGLMEAVFGEATARLVEAQRETTMSEDAFTNVIALGRAYIDWAMGNPELYRVMFMVTQGWEPSAEALANAMSALEPLAAEVARVPELDLPVESAALTLWSGVHGFCSLILLGAIRLPEEQFAAVREATLATLARGLRP